MTQNDELILKLKQQIQEKKAQLKSSEKFLPITNCSLELDSHWYNLNVLTLDSLILLMVQLNSLRLSALDLGYEVSLSGYKVEDWITDIKAKLAILQRKEEQAKLAGLESRLSKLLSEDKKVELELSDIMELLK